MLGVVRGEPAAVDREGVVARGLRIASTTHDMDFTPSPVLEKTRAEFRTWLADNLPDRSVWKKI